MLQEKKPQPKTTRHKKRYTKRMQAVQDFHTTCNETRLLATFFDILCGVLSAFLLIFYVLWLTQSVSKRKGKDDKGPMVSWRSQLNAQKILLPDMVDIMKWGHNGSGVRMPFAKLQSAHRDEHKLPDVLKWGDGGSKFNVPINTLDIVHFQEVVRGYSSTGFNQYVSDRISMRRELPDVRALECLRVNTLTRRQMPASSVSIIVVFRDEPWTTLLRTVYSIIDRSPPELLNEIILVDDGSTLDVLQYPRLEHYLSVLGKVRIIRQSKLGFAKARMEGARQAQGEVIIFLHARCECTMGWMVPLLAQVKKDEGAIAVPVVDRINPDTFQYMTQSLSQTTVGAFSWYLRTRQRYVPNPPELADESLVNPVISHGIFGIRKSFYLALGGLDAAFSEDEIRNIEFSFKAWLCGGTIDLVPCSHVGYVSVNEDRDLDDTTVRERKLVAQMWLDEYSVFVHERLPNTRTMFQGDSEYIRHCTKLKENMQCKNFSWFMHEVEPSMRLNERIIHRGRLLNIRLNTTVLALSMTEEHDVFLQEWYHSNSTVWYLMDNGQLKTASNTCLIANAMSKIRLPLETNSYKLKPEQSPDSSQFKSGQNEFQTWDKDANKYKHKDGKNVEVNNMKRDSALQQDDRNVSRIFSLYLLKKTDRIERKENQHLPSSNETEPARSPNFIKMADAVKKTNKSLALQNKTREFSDADKLLFEPDSNVIKKQAGQIQPPSDTTLDHYSEAEDSSDVSYLEQPKPAPAPLTSQFVSRPCHVVGIEGRWFLENGTLRHIDSGKCLEVHKATEDFYVLRMGICGSGNLAQIWTFSGFKR